MGSEQENHVHHPNQINHSSRQKLFRFFVGLYQKPSKSGVGSREKGVKRGQKGVEKGC
jgi:hypothetical protein